MGLDIYVIKPCPKEEALSSDTSDFMGIKPGYSRTSNKKVISNFVDYLCMIDEERDDWKEMGHPEFEDDSYWDTHSFYFCCNKFFVTDSANDISGYGCDSKEDLDIYMNHLIGNIIFECNVDDIPTKTIHVPYVYYKEVGYQRKGANQKFYEDGKWEDPDKCVVTQEELDHDFEEYFSHETPESEGGWGSGTEYPGLTDSERSNRFRKNIMEHFKEGETAVIYV